jgi:A/G-specific adenine glycosylase
MTESRRDRLKAEELRSLARRDGLTPRTRTRFRGVVWRFYRQHGRVFPWRQTDDPYRILVSEVMLQQTSTSRVRGKYEGFLAAFPSFEALAAAPLRRVLEEWRGLGYNRRAVALQRTAVEVLSMFEGRLPSDPATLRTLPGIGPYTASALAAIAFNRPAVFIETNIRAVFIHFFFQGRTDVDDREILPLVEATLDRAKPREWYYALFDYGAALKKGDDPGTRSAHYRRQSAFEGSNRQLRSSILGVLLARSSVREHELVAELGREPAQVRRNVRQMAAEGFLTISDDVISIA